MIGTHPDLTDTKCHLQPQGYDKPRAPIGWAVRDDKSQHDFQRCIHDFCDKATPQHHLGPNGWLAARYLTTGF